MDSRVELNRTRWDYDKQLPSASTTKSEDSAENDYAWLDFIDQDDCFMPLAQSDSEPSKTLDFGQDGCTGSLTTWHELLQITAPDSRCGVVFVRGDFPDNPDSILARAQRRNQKGTFGMTIQTPPEDKHWAQEPTAAQGLVNLRWPYTRLNWVRKNETSAGVPFATFSVCSFVRDDTVYQIARIVPKQVAQPSPAPSSVNLGLANQGSTTQNQTNSKNKIHFTVDVGGLIRFGCPSTITTHQRTTEPCPYTDDYTLEPPLTTPSKKNQEPQKTPQPTSQVFSCTSKKHKKRLEIRLWVDRILQDLPRHECELASITQQTSDVVSLHIRKDMEFDDRKTTVLAASFKLMDDDGSRPETSQPSVIGDNDVLDHLGVEDWSLHAPYRVWSALLSSSSSADSFELNAIARSVESTLGVASLPISPLPPADNAKTQGARIALLKNIITPQIVDLESAFWQIRLLVSAAKRLEADFDWEVHSNIPMDKRKQLQVMKACYYGEITEVVRGFVLWVLDFFGRVKTFDEPWDRLHDSAVGLLASDGLPIPPNDDARACKVRTPNCHIGQHKYYGSMILWYVMRNFPKVFTESPIVQTQLWANLSFFGNVQTHPNSSLPADDPNGCIVRWYHNFALLSICNMLREEKPDKFEQLPEPIPSLLKVPPPEQQQPSHLPIPSGEQQPDGPPTPNNGRNSLEKQVATWQTAAEKAMRLFEQGRLRGRDLSHETANLAIVGGELGVPDKAITIRGISCLQLAKKLVGRRKPTKKLNAGRSHILRWDPQHDIRSAKPRPAPWELSCLAHHIPYILGVGDLDRDKCVKRCMEFMFSDYSFMGSWDPSKPTTVGEWWDSVTTSIICTKLLDDSKTASPHGRLQPQGHTVTESDSQLEIRRAVTEGIEVLRKIHELHEKTNEKTNPVFPWKTMKPKKIYHSDTAVFSVEDTPNLDKIKRQPVNGNLDLRLNLKRYFDNQVLQNSGCPLNQIKQHIGASKLHNLSCLDIVLATANSDQPETSTPIIRGRADQAFWNSWADQDETRKQLLQLWHKKQGAGLQDMYLIGKADKHPCFKKNKHLFKDDKMREDLLEDYRAKLFLKLNDSLVDQGIKYRVIFAKRYSPVTMQAMVYMWHPDAIDTFDDHLGEISSFRDMTDQSVTGSENTWISSITIKHLRLLGETETMIRKAEKKVDEAERVQRWEARNGAKMKRWLVFGPKKVPSRIKPLDKSITTAKKVQELDKDRDFPPLGVRDDREGEGMGILMWNMHELSKIHELSVSLAITGDAMGRSWTCTVICELFDERVMAEYTEEASRILQMFIHQQDAARSLVFLMFLGYMCLAVAKECDSFIQEIDGVMKLDSKVLFNGMEWEKSDRALKKLKQMLWGYESLRSFRDMLEKAIEEVKKGREKMIKLLENGAAIRHEDMKSSALRIQEEFEKKFSRLETAYHSVQQRVEQGYKLREGITSVLGVEQNENISMLTWLTIIYLGPALVVGIFGMSENPILNDMNQTTFYRLLGGLLGGTILFALCLSHLISIIRFFWRHLTRPFKLAWDYSRKTVKNKVEYSWKHRHELFPLLDEAHQKTEADIERDSEASGNGAWRTH